MSEDKPHPRTGAGSWLDSVFLRLSNAPRTSQDLRDLIATARHNEVVNDDVLGIIEGALQVADLQVRHIMVPRPQMEVVQADTELEQVLRQITTSVHSRYPVLGESADQVLGMLLAKDLLPWLLDPQPGQQTAASLMRPAVLVPESMRLIVLLREFRQNRNHMAIVIDEYGSVAGLVTIEDVLEEIVGEIEDETDQEGARFISKVGEAEYQVKAQTPIEDFNREFDADFSGDEFDTIGGLILQQFGYLPTRNEKVELAGFEFLVDHADRRKIHSVRVHVGNR